MGRLPQRARRRPRRKNHEPQPRPLSAVLGQSVRLLSAAADAAAAGAAAAQAVLAGAGADLLDAGDAGARDPGACVRARVVRRPVLRRAARRAGTAALYTLLHSAALPFAPAVFSDVAAGAGCVRAAHQ